MSDAIPSKDRTRILVVENDAQWRQDHLKNLADWGYEAYAAEAPEEADDLFQALWDDALFKAHHYRCHIALVDMRLKDDGDQNDRSGLDLVPDLAPAVSIIVSGYGDKATVRAVLKPPSDVPVPHRAYDFVGKEDGPEALKKTIEEVKANYWSRFTKARIKWPFNIGDSGRLIERLFPDQPDVPAQEIEDLLWKLYPDAEQLKVHSLESDDRFPSTGSVRPRSVVIRVKRDKNASSDIVKIVRTDPTRNELFRYKEYVDDKFPRRHYAVLKSEVVLWDVQGARYLNVGEIGTLFRMYYREEAVGDISTVLNNFGAGWKTHYNTKKISGDETETLYQVYKALWGDNWHNRFGASAGALERTSSEFQEWFSKQLKLTDPIVWLKQRIVLEKPDETSDYVVSEDHSPNSIPLCVVHGDLQADNCFVDKTTKQMWLIDFERSGPGPIFADWVELEIDILTRLLPASAAELLQFLHLVINLLSPDPTKFWEPEDLPSGVSADMAKAFETIKTIRKHARATTGEDTRLYRWALLLNTAFRLTLPIRKDDNPTEEDNLALDERCVLLGGVICRSLDSGSANAWPPKSLSNPKKFSLLPKSPSSVSTISPFEYDVFISYSSKDRGWVVAELLPRLTAAKLRVCIDSVDFEPGASSVTEMERALTTSRKTVAILTQNYMDSGWTEFENLMLQTLDPANRERRFVPLRKEKVDLPLRIKYLVYVDFADPVDVDLSWQKLLKTLTPSEHGLPLS